MKNIIKILSIIYLLLLASCSGEIDPLDYVDGEEIRYPGKANEPTYLAGKERLKVQFKLGPDPNVNRAVIYWNLKKDSVVVDIDRASLKDNMVTKLIENLPENVYNFEIYTYDKFGNKSVPTFLTGRTYGNRYATVVADRALLNYELENLDGDLKLTWADSVIFSRGVDVKFTNFDNAKQQVFVANTEETSIIKRVKIEEPLEVYTLFLPEPEAIDTFFSKVVVTLDPSILKTMQLSKPYASAFVEGFDSPNNGGWGNIWNGNWGKTFDQNWGGVPWADEAGWATFETQDPNNDAESTWLTIDVKDYVKLSRYRTNFYWPYMVGCPKKSELWAYTGTEAPTAAEGWTNWVKIGSIDNSSFLLTVEDMKREYPLGDNMYFEPEDVPKSRYYRLRCYETWEDRAGLSRKQITIAEVTFWAHAGY